MTAADTVVDLGAPRSLDVKRCPECGTGFGVEAAFCPFDGIALKASTWDPTRDPLTDAVIDKRYEVIAPLGEGGMGTVYKVRHMSLDRMFAMKVLRRDLAADSGLAARFLQEARATAAIRHPSVVAISDFGSLDDGAPYFVMDLLVGQTLATRMRARGLLSPREAATIARKLADALSAAHAANVVHRDLKPENVFLVREGAGKASSDEEVRIVDFGAAKIVGGSKLTRPGVVFGTPYYMSPEQAGGQSVDARADIYSLGVLLYEMLTGKVPFEADTYMGVLTKHMFASPAKPSERAPSGVQLGELENVVLRALEKDPAARYQSMTELAAAIENATEGRAVEAPPKQETKSGRPLAFMQMSTADRIERSVAREVLGQRKRERRTTSIVIGGAVATVALGALAFNLLETSAAPKATRPAPSVSSASPLPSPAASASASITGVVGANVVGSVVAPEPFASPEAAVVSAPVASVVPSPPAVGAPSRPVTSARPRLPPTTSTPPKGERDPFTGKPAAPPPGSTASPSPSPVDPLDPWRR